jgi:hypothetical protein
LVQISFMARTCSRSRAKRVLYTVPWFSISSAFQPPPIPKRAVRERVGSRPPGGDDRVALAMR